MCNDLATLASKSLISGFLLLALLMPKPYVGTCRSWVHGGTGGDEHLGKDENEVD